MKRLLTFLLVLVLLAALLCGSAWYLLIYNSDWTVDTLTTQADRLAASGKYAYAIRLYRWAEQIHPDDQSLDVTLAETYRASGNYTKAEYTLSQAIAQGATTEVYEALCRIYVEQDKLLDAVTMLDQVADPVVKAALDAARPAAPTTDLEPGFYHQYMDVNLSCEAGDLYCSMDRNYPSLKTPYAGPLSLGLGETTVTAVAVGADQLVSTLSLFGYTVAGVVEPVTIQDPALNDCVREILSRGAESTLNTSDIWSITELDLPEGARDLSQLDLFTGLEKLSIHDRKEIDLTFLQAMPGLTALDLSRCTIDAEQLPIIGGLSLLQELNLSECQLSTLKGLENLTALTTLDLSMNSVSDLTPITNNSGLTTLRLQHNAVASAGPLRSLTALNVLNLSNNLLRDFTPLAACVNLSYLDVSVNNLNALNGVEHLTSLSWLDASHNQLELTEGISGCTILKELNLSNNVLTEMEEIATMASLETLDVSYNDIVEIPDFPEDAALSSFNGCHNFFEDVSGLAGLPVLNYVYLDYNNISDINVLSSCPALVQVNVFRTNVTNVSALLDMDIIISYNPT